MRRKPSLKAGDIFQNQYEILGVLGAGGHAFVYRVYNQILAREQALKLIEISADATRDRRRRARMEAQALCRLRHANVVGGEGAGVTEDGSVYILMELLRGPSLRAVLDEHRKLNIGEALLICAQVAEGVHEAHQLKIVHRDLKPENIIIEAGNRARVIDFGIAKFDAPDAQTTQRALVLGTTWYMSPEHIQGMTVTPRSDIFALATILYELIAGTRPNLVGLEVVEPNTINHRLLHVMPPYLDELVPSVPAEIAEFVQKMLAKNPEDRPESMAHVAQALRAFAARIGAAGEASSAVRDLALVTGVQARRWEHEHTTRRAEALRADPAPSNIPEVVAANQLALPIASVVHEQPESTAMAQAAPKSVHEPETSADSGKAIDPPSSREAKVESSRSGRTSSHPSMRVSRIDPAPGEHGASKETLRFGSVVADPAAPISSGVAPNSSPEGPQSAHFPDSERRSPTGPGYTREIAPSSTKKARLAGVTSDPLWLRVMVAGIATGSLAAVVLVSAFLKVYRPTYDQRTSGSALLTRGGSEHAVTAPPPGARVEPSVRSVAVETDGATSEDSPAATPSAASTSWSAHEATTQAVATPASPPSTPVALAKPTTKQAHRPGPTKPASSSPKTDARLTPSRAAPADRLVTPDDWAMPSSGLSDEPAKRPTTKGSAKRTAPSSAAPKAPAQDKDDRINLIFPRRSP